LAPYAVKDSIGTDAILLHWKCRSQKKSSANNKDATEKLIG
jgi:hypothetical protein